VCNGLVVHLLSCCIPGAFFAWWLLLWQLPTVFKLVTVAGSVSINRCRTSSSVGGPDELIDQLCSADLVSVVSAMVVRESVLIHVNASIYQNPPVRKFSHDALNLIWLCLRSDILLGRRMFANWFSSSRFRVSFSYKVCSNVLA